MPLVLAIKNSNSIVVASDSDGTPLSQENFGQLMPLPNRSVLLIVGNLEAVRHAVLDVVVPKVRPDLSAAGLAQLVQAALVVEVVPKLAQLTGRVEFIIAGIDPIRHVDQPGLYYLDSAQDFYLRIIDTDAVAAGSTAAVTSLLAGHSYTNSQVGPLQVLAKECMSATKLRWPDALGSHMRLGVVNDQSTRIQDI